MSILSKALSLFTRGNSAKIGWFLPPCPSLTACESTLPVLKIARPMRSSSQGPVEGPSAYAPFTRCFANCCCSVEFLTPDEARDPGFTIIVTYSPCIPYDAGIETVRIWTPNFLFWLPRSEEHTSELQSRVDL